MSFDRAFDVSEGIEVRSAGAGRGEGLFATRPLPRGTVLFRERPLVAMAEPGRARVETCERCCAFLGPLERQLCALLPRTDLRALRHARATNPIFLLAAKSAAAVLRRLAAGDSPDAAMAPYPGPAWEDAVPPPPGADAAAFRETLRKLLTQSWLLLCAVLAPHTPAAASSSSSAAAAASSCMFASAALYSRIVGSFERRNCSLAEYFLAVDAMPDGEARAAAEAVTRPLLESLGSRYRTHCDAVNGVSSRLQL
ncbi:hypothetical protein EMIHUDRAFT_100213 [Emiliania huxleyi CCMP1516]|uniref:Uncharacterized protein n=2 Tax=Emiliania huxleyi TaxID=2903 RepID=A0A0D3JWH6_EMIH1|nr:hypothetical protein EMIHUDRAFT_100213 [Emiliania huxleyi CCMP1516]EOD27861.1 hypothetical protein EMIHUDRAFT_100213 [Emiliania huxleyi CCMP1516]|eukprot:XP_005780290.1 hypothetical protein EMIHUDRAFT_100213 [Emiliania huxleyi CCMP1516]